MRRIYLLLVAAIAAFTLPGCPMGPGEGGMSSGPQPPATPPTMPGDPNTSLDPNASQRSKRYKLVVTVQLSTIEVPVGTASGSEEIWSYLDEEPIKAVRAASLGRNGFRVGLGRTDAWPDVVRILKRMTGRSPRQNLLASMPASPMSVMLKEGQAGQTIFTFHDDRTLSGQDYPPGDYLLVMVCTLDEDDLSKIMMTVMPRIRSTKKRRTFVMGPGGAEMVTQSDAFNFDQLTFQLMIPPKGFLVIGPGANARNPSSAAHHFLVKKRDGMEFETLLILTPKAFATPIK